MNNSPENKTDQQSTPDTLSRTCRNIDKAAFAAAVLGIIASIGQKVDQNINTDNKIENESSVPAGERDPRCDDNTLYYVETEVDKMVDAIIEMDSSPTTVETNTARKRTYDLDFNIDTSSYTATLVDVDCRKEHADKCYGGEHPFHEHAEYLRFHNKDNNRALRYMLFKNGIGVWLENKIRAEPWAFVAEFDLTELHRCWHDQKSDHTNIPAPPVSVLLGFDYNPKSRYLTQPAGKDHHLYIDTGFDSFTWTQYLMSPHCSNDTDKNKQFLLQTTEKFFKGVGHAYLEWKKRKAEAKARSEERDRSYAEDI